MKFLNVEGVLEMQRSVRELNALDPEKVCFVLPGGTIITPSREEAAHWKFVGLGCIAFMEQVLSKLEKE